MEEKWRKELKYTVTEGESIVTARRLSSFMQRDKNLKGGREYLIRSLYFDNLYEKVLKEKLSGTGCRLFFFHKEMKISPETVLN